MRGFPLWPLRSFVAANEWSPCEFYHTREPPSADRLCDAHAALDAAVRAAYGMKDQEDSLAFLLLLTVRLAGLPRPSPLKISH